MNATQEQPSYMSIGVALERGDEGIPETAACTNCNIELGFPENWIRLSGSDGNRELLLELINAVISPLSSFITEEMDRIACDLVVRYTIITIITKQL